MRVMIDTNVIISALMFPASKPADVLVCVAEEHELILCDYIVSEVEEKIAQKRPDLVSAVKVLFESMLYRCVPSTTFSGHVISDPKDQPILNASLKGDVDVMVTGDKHFKKLNLERPQVMSPAEFLDTFR
ncbi:MAG: putative toxin-antitoxin system toxin component, PIN family [Coriobacteriia bacterium]|nr:putative toxin-antitoxin system toxin component, PIN family [Coriobacteriia bacterium]